MGLPQSEVIGITLLVCFLIFITARGSLLTYARLLFAGNAPAGSAQTGSTSSAGSGGSTGSAVTSVAELAELGLL